MKAATEPSSGPVTEAGRRTFERTLEPIQRRKP